jgi:hypothetical protein
MISTPKRPEEEFTEAEHDWKLEELYADLASAKQQLAPYKRKGLTPIEKRHLRGLLCGYSPAEIARKLCKDTRGVEVDLCKTLYRYTETLTIRPANKLNNWRDVIDWLEEAGYRKLSNQFQELAPLESSAPGYAFIAGPPIIYPRYFFGRERELKRLPLQNAAIIGPRRSGKTSLLLYLKSITTTPPAQLRCNQRTDWMPRPERYRWIFVDFQDPRLGNQEGLLRYLLACLDLPAPNSCDLDRFLDLVSRSLHAPTVILLDELSVALQRYRELDDPFWEALRSLANNQVEGNLAFVLAASEPPEQIACRSSLGSPFFNIFGYTAQLKPLIDQEARELIASSPICFPPADIDWILAQSRCWPILLQILCRERLVALEVGETDDAWKKEGLEQIKRYGYLLED